jgi:hypothetical protein
MAKSMSRTIVKAAMIFVVLAGPAAAQVPMGFPLGGSTHQMTQEEVDRQKALDKAYDSAKKKIPDKTAPADPWGSVRAPSPATASKSKP